MEIPKSMSHNKRLNILNNHNLTFNFIARITNYNVKSHSFTKIKKFRQQRNIKIKNKLDLDHLLKIE